MFSEVYIFIKFFIRWCDNSRNSFILFSDLKS
jgi:hypothetical protein